MAIRIGFVGTGGIATHKHMPALQGIEGAEMVVMCDTAEGRAQETAGKFGGEVFTDYRRMFDEVEMDAVYVCVPPFAHEDAEMIAAEKGIHLFVEKPVALTMEKALEVMEKVEKAGIVTSVGYGPRNTAAAHQTKAFLEGKTVVMAMVTRLGGVPGEENHWWRVMSRSEGALVEQTTHNLDLLRYLIGDVKEVSAHYDLRGVGDLPNLDVPDSQMIQLIFEDGTPAFVGISCALTKGGGGQTADLILRDMRVSYTRDGLVLRPEGAAELPPLPEVPHIDQVFVDAVRTGDVSQIGCFYREGAKTLDVTLAANASAETGKPVVPYFARA